MASILDRILDYLRVKEIRALNVDNEKKEVTRHWPRLLSFTPGAQPCDDEEGGGGGGGGGGGDDDDDDANTNQTEVDEIELVSSDEPEDVYLEEDNKRCGPSSFSRKFNCMYHSARYGLKEGALSGIFFGGAWGIYKYVDAVYIKKENKEESEDGSPSNSEENYSTVNDNIIFVTAAHGAIAMGVFCTFFCCTKAAIYCN